MNIIRPRLLNGIPNLICGLSTRPGGCSPPPYNLNLSFRVGDDPANVKRNREMFFGELGIGVDRLAIPGQVHGSVVHNADRPGNYPGCDALITDRVRVFVSISVADCVPILLYDTRRGIVAAVHAGWRGTSAGIASEVVKKLKEEFSSNGADILAYVGPCAAECCYTVGEDVASRFDDGVVRRERGQVYVDLKAANVHQLLNEGIPENQIEVSTQCTISDAALFHSHRRDKSRSGRMMGVIGMI